MRKKDLCVRIARWALLLQEFNYTIEHRPGKSMRHIDTLNCNPLATCMIISECSEDLTYYFKIPQQEDGNLKRIVSFVEDNKTKDYIIRGGLLFKDCDGNIKLVVPKSMTRQVIRSAHERAHFSVAKTTAIVNRDYWISDAKAIIQKIVKNCITCILAERKCGKAEGYLQPLDKGEVPLDTYHIDHLGPLPSTRKNYKHILAVVDAFSKFVWFHAIKGTGNRSNFKAPKTSPPYLEALEEL